MGGRCIGGGREVVGGWEQAGIKTTLTEANNPHKRTGSTQEFIVERKEVEFQVNSNGARVSFAKGNLRWGGTEKAFNLWENQYDFAFADKNKYTKTTTAPKMNEGEYIDLFGWCAGAGYGTSNTSDVKSFKAPWYKNDYGYDGGTEVGNISNNSVGSATWNDSWIFDWGNTISGGYRTLTADEWVYLLYTRGKNSQMSYIYTALATHWTGAIATITHPATTKEMQWGCNKGRERAL